MIRTSCARKGTSVMDALHTINSPPLVQVVGFRGDSGGYAAKGRHRDIIGETTDDAVRLKAQLLLLGTAVLSIH